MSEETIKELNYINDNIKKYIKDNDIKGFFYAVVGGVDGFGFLSSEMIDEILELQKVNQQLKRQLNQKLTPNELVDMLNQELVKQLQQRDEVIEEAITFIDDKNNYFEDGENWDNVKKIKEILNKYKGDNNE